MYVTSLSSRLVFANKGNEQEFKTLSDLVSRTQNQSVNKILLLEDKDKKRKKYIWYLSCLSITLSLALIIVVQLLVFLP